MWGHRAERRQSGYVNPSLPPPETTLQVTTRIGLRTASIHLLTDSLRFAVTSFSVALVTSRICPKCCLAGCITTRPLAGRSSGRWVGEGRVPRHLCRGSPSCSNTCLKKSYLRYKSHIRQFTR